MVDSLPDGNFARKKVGRLIGSRIGRDGGFAFELYESTEAIDESNVEPGDVYLVEDESDGLVLFGYNSEGAWEEL